MSKTSSFAAAVVAVVAFGFSAEFANAQHCAGCASGAAPVAGGFVDSGFVGGGYQQGGFAQGGFARGGFAQPVVGDSFFSAGGGCATGNCGGGNAYGYPDGPATGGHFGGRHQHGQLINSIKANKAHLHANNRKVMARNQAWPSPFAYTDRQAYFSVWDPMISTGMQDMCTLTSAHFDHEGQLNGYGESAVAAIMQNMPKAFQNIHIEQSANGMVSDQRMSSVRNVVQKWYGSNNPAIAFTERVPMRHSGGRALLINTAYSSGVPAPGIALSDSTGSTSDTGQ